MSEEVIVRSSRLAGNFILSASEKTPKATKIPPVGKNCGGDGIFGGLWKSPSGLYRVYLMALDLTIKGQTPKERLKNITLYEALKEVTTRRHCGHNFSRSKTEEDQLKNLEGPFCKGRWSIPTIDVLELVAKNLFEEDIAPSSLGLKGTYLSFTEDPKNPEENILAVTFEDGVEPKTISIPKANRVRLRAMRFVKCVTNG